MGPLPAVVSGGLDRECGYDLGSTVSVVDPACGINTFADVNFRTLMVRAGEIGGMSVWPGGGPGPRIGVDAAGQGTQARPTVSATCCSGAGKDFTMADFQRLISALPATWPEF